MAMAKMIRWTVSDLFCLRPNSRPHMWHDRVRLQLAKHWGREPVRIISWGKQRPQQHWTFLVEWFFFRICLKKGFVERLMEISKKWIPIGRQNHQRVSALPRLGYRFAVHLWFPQWLLHTLPKLQRSCCMPSGRFHMHLEWFPSPWQFWLKKWEMLFHVWFILKFYSQLEIGFNDLLHYDSWISTFKLGIRYTVYGIPRYTVYAPCHVSDVSECSNCGNVHRPGHVQQTVPAEIQNECCVDYTGWGDIIFEASRFLAAMISDCNVAKVLICSLNPVATVVDADGSVIHVISQKSESRMSWFADATGWEASSAKIVRELHHDDDLAVGWDGLGSVLNIVIVTLRFNI